QDARFGRAWLVGPSSSRGGRPLAGVDAGALARRVAHPTHGADRRALGTGLRIAEGVEGWVLVLRGVLDRTSESAQRAGDENEEVSTNHSPSLFSQGDHRGKV